MEKRNKESFQRRIIYRCREVSLSQTEKGYIVAVEGERERFFTNVLEAWTNFIDTLDSRGRRRIREYQSREEGQL